MLDFRQSTRNQRPGPRPEHRKIVSLIMGVAIVLILMTRLGNKRSWEWFVQLSGEGPAAKDEDLAPPPAADRQGRLPGDVIEIPDPNEEARSLAVLREREFFPGIRLEELAKIRDDTTNRSEEVEPLFHLLQVLRDADPAALDAAAEPDVTFRQLYHQSESYRGRLLALRGYVVSAERIKTTDAIHKQYGIDGYDMCWILLEDRIDRPLNLIVLNLPPEMPRGENLREEIRFTGLHVKRWLYAAKNQKVEATPRLLARTVRWVPPAEVVAPGGAQFLRVAVWGIGLGLLIVGGMLFAGKRSQRLDELRQRHTERVEQVSFESVVAGPERPGPEGPHERNGEEEA